MSLPKGWSLEELGGLGDWAGGGTPSKQDPRFWDGGTIPWVSPKDMKLFEIHDSEDHITEQAVSQSAAKRIPAGSVLFVTRSGILERTLPVAVTGVEVTMNQDLKALTPGRGIEPKCVAYAARANEQTILRECSKDGTTVASIETDRLKRFAIPIPPAPEQPRIVDALESHLTRIDAAIATLERVQRNLTRYRASVLKAAVEGRLVPPEAELARTEGRDYEPASKLLQRILTERRQRWEQSGRKGKYEEPAGPNVAELAKLPEGWSWATVDQLTDGARSCGYGVLVPGPDVEGGIPLIRVGDIGEGRVDQRQLKRIAPAIAVQFSRTFLRGGEVLISLVGTIGRTAVAPETLAGANVARAVGVIPVSGLVMPGWVEHWFRSPRQRSLVESKAHEVARKTLNLEDVRAANVAVPPLAEQGRILEVVSDQMSVAEASLGATQADVTRLVRLRQSILKWAFEGKLVDQDPNDEPASVLLERIKAERGAAAPVTKSRAKKPRAKVTR